MMRPRDGSTSARTSAFNSRRQPRVRNRGSLLLKFEADKIFHDSIGAACDELLLGKPPRRNRDAPHAKGMGAGDIFRSITDHEGLCGREFTTGRQLRASQGDWTQFITIPVIVAV